MSSLKITKLASYECCPNFCEDGKVYNNADNTSGQWHQCEECDYNFVSRKKIQFVMDKMELAGVIEKNEKAA